MRKQAGQPPKRPNTYSLLPADEVLLDLVQHQTFTYFWDAAHQPSGMAFDRISAMRTIENVPIATGGTGAGVMAMIVAAERRWVRRGEAVERLSRILTYLETAVNYYGAFPHFFDVVTGQEFTFWQGNAGGDIVETAFLMAGLLCARQYFGAPGKRETALRRRIDALWQRVDWNWFTGGETILMWHWNPSDGFSNRHQIYGWDECLIAYVLAASSPTYRITPEPYHQGWAQGVTFRNGREFYGKRLPLGPDFGGPLFYAHTSFLGLDPRGLKDHYADYWEQVTAHTLINYEHCVYNPNGFKGYGENCWGLTASDGDQGYAAHAPKEDRGVIAPTAALSSFPYAPELSMRALKHFYYDLGDRIWQRYGFVDAFNLTAGWYGTDHLAIDQGPIIVMIENYRTGLLWRLFMSCPEVQQGLDVLGFEPRPSV
jgi:hypothetical protein